MVASTSTGGSPARVDHHHLLDVVEAEQLPRGSRPSRAGAHDRYAHVSPPRLVG
jgi:hypothetical protein